MTQHPSAPVGRPRIDGLYELGHVLDVLDADTHGFSRGDMERVESFWSFSEMDSSSAGFVVRLGDGRRAYIDFLHWHGFEQDEDFRIKTEFLSTGRALPSPLGPAPWPPGDWTRETSHLDLSLIHISEPTRQAETSYAVFCV